MLYELIEKVQAGDNEAMLIIIEKFEPLNKKYARKLNYEDAYNDLILNIIKLVKNMKLNKFNCTGEGAMVSYIVTCVYNQYIFLLKKIIINKQEISLSEMSEEQKYIYDVKTSVMDVGNPFVELQIKEILTEDEYKLIYQIYVLEYSVCEIARNKNTSRQAINQKKIRILRKIRNWCDKRG